MCGRGMEGARTVVEGVGKGVPCPATGVVPGTGLVPPTGVNPGGGDADSVPCTCHHSPGFSDYSGAMND